MKKLNIFILLISLAPFTCIKSQNYSAPGVSEQHPIKEKFNEKGKNSSGIAYGWSAVSGYIISVPIPEGQPITLVQPWSPQYTPTAMVDNINEYIIDDGYNYWLYQPNNGNMYNLGTITGLGEEHPNGLAIDFNNLYTTYIITDENLYRFIYWTNPMTVELVGSFGIPGSKMIDIAIDCCSNAYTYDINSDQSYKIDLSTGQATLLGSIGFDANEGQGMSFDENSGQIFLSAFNNSTQTAQLRTLNTETGLTTLIVDWGIEHIDAFAIEGFCDYGNCKVGDKFEYGLCDWDITNDGGNCIWEIRHMFSNYYQLSETNASGFLLAADADQCGTGSSMFTTATMKFPLSAGQTCYYLSFDHDWKTMDSEDEAHVEVSTDGGATWETIVSWIGINRRNSSEYFDITNLVYGKTFLIRFRVVQPGWDWWWVIDNFCITECIPVEFTSFTATVDSSDVILNWSTATELNSKGFEILRSTQIDYNNWKKIGLVSGFGTTTEMHNYSFTDKSLQSGKYQYRLKQIDLDGSFQYSQTIKAIVEAPTKFKLAQNYPNPFNPSTSIKYAISSRQFVSLKVYDVLGNEVATLVNEIKKPGYYEVNFNASNLASGVYFYRLASGSFVSTRKMLLLK